MSFTVKDWRNATTYAGGGDESTPLSAEALEDLEERVTDYADDRLAEVVINVKDFGAAGDGSADDTAEIQAAIASLPTGVDGTYPTGGVVFFPPGVYIISSQIVVPHRVRLQGSGMYATSIKAHSSFPTSNALIRLGDGSRNAFYCRVDDMIIHCNSVTGTRGIYSEDLNEGSGATRVIVANYGGVGVDLQPNATSGIHNYHAVFDDVWILQSDPVVTGTIGFRYDGGSVGVQLRRVTVTAQGVETQDRAFQLTSHEASPANVTLLGVNCENHNVGIYVDDGAGATIVQASLSSDGTYLLYIDSDEPVVAQKLSKTVGTHLVQNVTTGKSITASDVSLYVTGAMAYVDELKTLEPINFDVTGGSTSKLDGDNAIGTYIDWDGTRLLARGNSTATNLAFCFDNAQTAASAPNNSLFRDSADGKLKYKDNGGTTNALY